MSKSPAFRVLLQITDGPDKDKINFNEKYKEIVCAIRSIKEYTNDELGNIAMILAIYNVPLDKLIEIVYYLDCGLDEINHIYNHSYLGLMIMIYGERLGFLSNITDTNNIFMKDCVYEIKKHIISDNLSCGMFKDKATELDIPRSVLNMTIEEYIKHKNLHELLN